MKITSAALALAGLLTLSACGSSPPTRFYLLTPSPPAQAAARRAGAPVRVAAIHLPDELDRLEIVTGLNANQLEIRGEDRWAAPLDDMSRRVLAQDLGQRLAPGRLVLAHSPSPRSTRELVVDVQSFGIDGSGLARLQGAWSLADAAGQPSARRSFDLTEPVAGRDPQAQAAAMSRLLARLADQIAQELPS